MFYFGSDDGALYAMTKSIVPHKAVFLPDSIRNRKGLRAVRGNRLELCNYLVSKQYERLDSASLFGFLTRRIGDKEPSVIVFTLASIPKNIVGENPKTGLIRQYLDTGGKIVWADRVANTTTWNGEERPVRDVSISNAFLSISYDDLGESGNYYSEATQEGENWGLPHGLKSTNFIVKQSEEITPLAIDEFGRTSIWNKQFHDRQGSGFVSCRTWAWNVPIKEQDMEIIHRLAIYGLE